MSEESRDETTSNGVEAGVAPSPEGAPAPLLPPPGAMASPGLIADAPPPVPPESLAPVPPPPAVDVPSPGPAARPRAGWRANLAALSIVPFAMLAGALARPDRDYPRSFADDAIAGAIIVGFFALFAAPLTRLAHRWAVDALALAAGGALWFLGSVAEDFRARPRVSELDSLAFYHRGSVSQALEWANLLDSAGGLLLGAVGLVLALLLTSRHDPAARPLPRSLLVGSLVPLAAVSLLAAHGAGMIGFVATTIALATFALGRVATRVNLADRRSLGLALASVLASTGAVAAAASGATLHGLALVLHDAIQGDADARHLAALVDRYLALGPGAATPILAFLPPFAFGCALDRRGWPSLPRVTMLLSTGVLALLLWLDARNAVDVRHHVGAYLRVRSVVDVAQMRDVQSSRLDDEGPVEDGFVIVPLAGPPRYRGVALPAGPRRFAGLVHDRIGPPVLLDARLHARDALALIAAMGVHDVQLVVRSTSMSRFGVVSWGPLIGGVPTRRGYEDRVYLLLLVARGGCRLMSTAGERIDIDACGDELSLRLEERRAAEPNRRDIIIVPTDDAPMPRLLDTLARANRAGYDRRYAMRMPSELE